MGAAYLVWMLDTLGWIHTKYTQQPNRTRGKNKQTKQSELSGIPALSLFCVIPPPLFLLLLSCFFFFLPFDYTYLLLMYCGYVICLLLFSFFLSSSLFCVLLCVFIFDDVYIFPTHKPIGS